MADIINCNFHNCNFNMAPCAVANVWIPSEALAGVLKVDYISGN